MDDKQKKLTELLEKDEALRKEVFEKATIEEAFAAAKAVLQELTEKDFEVFVQGMRKGESLLSDEQLDMATGGYLRKLDFSFKEDGFGYYTMR